jgi:hypothetical protein
MGLAQYAIVAVEDQWGVLHDGDIKTKYATKEAAFDSAIRRFDPSRPSQPVRVSLTGC